MIAACFISSSDTYPRTVSYYKDPKISFGSELAAAIIVASSLFVLSSLGGLPEYGPVTLVALFRNATLHPLSTRCSNEDDGADGPYLCVITYYSNVSVLTVDYHSRSCVASQNRGETHRYTTAIR